MASSFCRSARRRRSIVSQSMGKAVSGFPGLVSAAPPPSRFHSTNCRSRSASRSGIAPDAATETRRKPVEVDRRAIVQRVAGHTPHGSKNPELERIVLAELTFDARRSREQAHEDARAALRGHRVRARLREDSQRRLDVAPSWPWSSSGWRCRRATGQRRPSCRCCVGERRTPLRRATRSGYAPLMKNSCVNRSGNACSR